ncbi:helix-turn-helix transcriptional regulator [Flexivirga endophytica]|uniref:helix-turn-helix transcriptional regulator n=1 Tax=Flexivirga endophytica TaxID=1849103 RepID=UPI001667F478|nr:PAS domain-containing protein [Flexivirga endophytica]
MPHRTVDGERVLGLLCQLVEPIGRSLPSSIEVVLHDLSLLPNSIVAIHGDVTGRSVGDPATDVLLDLIAREDRGPAIGYVSTLPDGRSIRSTTMLVRDVSGQQVAALCLNADLAVWTSVQGIVDAMLGSAQQQVERPRQSAAVTEWRELDASRTEVFAKSVDELADHLIRAALARRGVPVELMHKRHKLEVVRDLRGRGLFHIKDAVDMVATALDVTRYTVYNYLNELKDDEAGSGPGAESENR